MNDSYGRIVSIWIGCILMFLLPVSFYAWQQVQLEQMYILTETAYFVDSVRNTGRLTSTMMKDYEDKLSFGTNSYIIELEHAGMTYRNPKYGYEPQRECYYTMQIREILENTGEYDFHQEDFFLVRVREKGRSMAKRLSGMFLDRMLYGEEDIIVYYGGMIRYEVE